MTLKDVERRLLLEYLALPGLSLSLAQAARLMCVDAPTCQTVLNDLVHSGHLSLGGSGAYVRLAGAGDLDLWKSRMRNRLAAAGHSSASRIAQTARVPQGRPRRQMREALKVGEHASV
jgi:hypothetical protein